MVGLAVQRIAVIGVVARHHLRGEAAISVEVLEVRRCAQQKGLAEAGLEMAVTALDRPVLVGQVTIVAAGLHPVVPAQGVVALAQIVARRLVQIGESCGQAVGTMLPQGAAQCRPETKARSASRWPGP